MLLNRTAFRMQAPPRRRVAVYDNPETDTREVWEDGALIEAASLASILLVDETSSPQVRRIANVGQWTPGKVWGDQAALTGSE